MALPAEQRASTRWKLGEKMGFRQDDRLNFSNINALGRIGGEEVRIRTLGTCKGTMVFETAPIARSGTSPLAQAQAP